MIKKDGNITNVMPKGRKPAIPDEQPAAIASPRVVLEITTPVG
jgi:hypothetical protein